MAATQKSPHRTRLDEHLVGRGLLRQPLARPRRHRPRAPSGRRPRRRQGRPGGFSIERHPDRRSGPRLCLARRAEADRRARSFRSRPGRLHRARHRRLDRRLHAGAAGARRGACHGDRRRPRPDGPAASRADPRVTCIEGLNARDLVAADLARPRCRISSSATSASSR